MDEFHKTSGFFTAFRQTYGFPYFARETPFDYFRQIGIWGIAVIYITTILGIAIIIALLGTRGYSRWRITLQMAISLVIGATIIVCATGIKWQMCDYEANEDGFVLKYRVFIGLSQANITMARMTPTSTEYTEYHNLKIGWIDVHQAQEEYKDALRRGWPVNMLRLARYISADMDGMRYMSSFRWAGYAAKILLWTAFAAWLLANVLVSSHVSYSATFLLLTGALQLLACIVYDSESPSNFLIPIDDGIGSVLRLRYAWMFWLSLFMGIFVILMGAIILILDYLRPEDMNKFFGTHSEFHSPYDEELIQNRNKDLKGMIRNLSQKRGRNDVRKQANGQNSLDAERARKTPFNIYSRTGADNPAFDGPMTSIQQREEREKRNKELPVPGINVEMVDIPSDTDERYGSDIVQKDANHNGDIHIDSESEYERTERNGSVTATSSLDGEETSTIPTPTSSRLHLTVGGN